MKSMTPQDFQWEAGWPLGDYAARLFSLLGIKARPGCRCAERQHWLNQLGRKLKFW